MIDVQPGLKQDHPCFGCAVREISLCGVLDNDELLEYRRTGSTVSLESGKPLFFEGDPADAVFTITTGALRLSKLLADGRRQIAGFLFPGDFLGLTVEDVHLFTAEAVVPSELCRFSRPRFERFLDEHPHMGRRLFAVAAHELAAARLQVVLLGRKTATEKVVSFLLWLASRCRKHGYLADDVELPMTRTDIADYLGLRIETVSRELSGLRARHMIKLTGMHSLQLLNKPALQALAEG
ncbi:MAG: cyclic nucleotide-binding domain-containing protein [Sphingomicrobium sp.]